MCNINLTNITDTVFPSFYWYNLKKFQLTSVVKEYLYSNSNLILNRRYLWLNFYYEININQSNSLSKTLKKSKYLEIYF